MICLQDVPLQPFSISATRHLLIGILQTATFGSEFVTARIAVDQIMDFRTTLRYLGVPIKTTTYMFGDNQAVVTNSAIPHSFLSKRHNALSYH
jgi:hypothetical protein